MTPYVNQAASTARERESDHLGWQSVCKWCYRLSMMTVGWWLAFAALAWVADQVMEIPR